MTDPSGVAAEKDNCAWYRFDAKAAGCNTIFHGR